MYSYDSSFLARFRNFVPDAVVLPRSTAEVFTVMRLASEHGIISQKESTGCAKKAGLAR